MKLIVMTDYDSRKIPPPLKLHIIVNEGDGYVAHLGLEGGFEEIISNVKEIHNLLGKLLDKSPDKMEEAFKYDRKFGWYVLKDDKGGE